MPNKNVRNSHIEKSTRYSYFIYIFCLNGGNKTKIQALYIKTEMSLGTTASALSQLPELSYPTASNRLLLNLGAYNNDNNNSNDVLLKTFQLFVSEVLLLHLLQVDHVHKTCQPPGWCHSAFLSPSHSDPTHTVQHFSSSLADCVHPIISGIYWTFRQWSEFTNGVLWCQWRLWHFGVQRDGYEKANDIKPESCQLYYARSP